MFISGEQYHLHIFNTIILEHKIDCITRILHLSIIINVRI